MKYAISLLFLLFSSCAQMQSSNIEEIPKFDFPEVEVRDIELTRGHVKQVRLSAYGGLEKKLRCADERVGFDRDGDQLRVFLGGPYYYDEDVFSCYLTLEHKGFEVERPVLNVTIRSHEFESERLNVDRRHVDLSDEDAERWVQEQEELKRVYSGLNLNRAYFTESFVRPLDSVITSPYGRERVFNDEQASWHRGIDFRAWYDTPIPTSNRGRVVFAGDLLFNGKTVIVDHGLGIVTLYCHLNEIKVEVGDIVPKGAVVGLSGNTGRSTAPHLHWGVRVAGQWVNGFSLVEYDI